MNDLISIDKWLKAIPLMPRVGGRPKTFLSIAKQPHYENVWSNIYAFYFRCKEAHQLNDVFIKSLVNLINEKLAQTQGSDPFYLLEQYEVETEVSTDRKGRIDLLLYNAEQAIIIENKVFHHLANDLEDYWNSVLKEVNDTRFKIGVILSLYPISKDQYANDEFREKFINITHLELVSEIKKSRPVSTKNKENKYLVFLDDFIQNIINMSKPVMEEKDVTFYLKNQQKINEVVKFNKAVNQHVVSEVENAGLRLDNYRLDSVRNKFNNKRLRHYVSKVNPDLMFTIIFDGLLKANELIIIIDVKNELLKKHKEMLLGISPSGEYKNILDPTFKEDTANSWAHFAIARYKLKSPNEYARLADAILTKLENDGFIRLMQAVENQLIKR